MKIWISANDVHFVYRSAITRVAECIKIENVDLKSNYELYEEVYKSNSSLLSPLTDFLNSYLEWYNYVLKSNGNSETNQSSEYFTLQSNRDQKRICLISAIEVFLQKK